jgi:DNA-binding NarL/FixJ family response regulator
VFHPVACYRRGLVATLLEAGFAAEQPDWAAEQPHNAAEQPDGAAEWAAEPGPRAVFVLASSPEFPEVVALLADRRDLTVVALLGDPAPPAYREVIDAGAFPLAWDASPATIVALLEAALGGQVVVPSSVVAALAAPVPPAGEPPGLDDIEVLILARLARGDTDRRIASALRVSERTVRRRLQAIFAKIGVETRVQAGVYAAHRGLDRLAAEQPVP